MDRGAVSLQAELRQKVSEIRQIVTVYEWIVDAYIVDFFQENHWSNLPASWAQCLAGVSIRQLPELLRSDSRHTEVTVWPLAMLALRSLFHRLELPRGRHQAVADAGAPECVFQRQAALFRKSVKLKKRHEIEQFAVSCRHETVNRRCHALVDIGSGQGNLARALAYGYGLRVCCIEQNGTFVQAARAKDVKLWKRLVRIEPKVTDTLAHPVHVHETVDLEHIEPERFVRMLRTALNVREGDEFRFGLVGLHPCGDLAPSLLRLFLACRDCTSVQLVCCCYMKLSCVRASPGPLKVDYGFPLSNLGRKTRLSLSYQAREIACHANEQYSDRLVENYQELKIHAYRAAIECIIVRLRPDLKHSGLRGGIKAAQVSFEQYCWRAVDGLDLTVPSDEIHSPEVHHRLERWEEVVKFYTLRLMFAPLLESLILYDRWLFLLEKGVNAKIGVLFDPRASPRNHSIIAFK
ncbi:methyltransferase-like protein 25B [Anopheles cruzii]|uniref:methyltransferase-like protein 25B n=1 Tax=Anopheles cruzii TaxID=68878 RepID=UPI0022EC358E|nr:methyltransferase-like protein 25B [Anopheles cruzii]